MPTLYDIAKDYKVTKNGKASKDAKSIVEGIEPATELPSPGYRNLTPEELASLEVPTLEVNGQIDGYQREDKRNHVRQIALALARGEEMPPILVSLYDGKANVTEGQHRALGGIAANRPVPAVVKHRTLSEQKRLFANQRKAKPVSNDTIVLAANGAFAEYVQDAVTSPDHAWAEIVGPRRSESKIGPSQMYGLVVTYVARIQRTRREAVSDDRFDRAAADRLAELLLAFGSRKENPMAWRPVAIRAIGLAALKILRENGEQPEDVERWKRQMPLFPFARYMVINRSDELSKELIRHWNKRLGASRQVEL